MQRAVSAFAIAGCVLTLFPVVSLAQGLPGLTIFSGVDRDYQLGYRLDEGGRTSRRDRYHLRLPADRIERAVEQFIVSYPDSYDARFDDEEIEVRVDGDSIPLDEVRWDQENRIVEIFPTEPVPANTRVEIVFSNVYNPRTPGTHYFNALLRYAGDIPLASYAGTWIISIGGN